MLSQAKQQERIRNMSAVAQKVYSAVPLAEEWSLTHIVSEMQRTGGSVRDLRIIQGCLNSLKEAGLVLEPERSVFIRAPVRQEKEKTVEPEIIEVKEPPMKATAKQSPRAPMAILSELASRCKQLADEIETAALEIDEYVSAKDADAGKLKQLQNLLKSLS